jgi:hypothetical protein
MDDSAEFPRTRANTWRPKPRLPKAGPGFLEMMKRDDHAFVQQGTLRKVKGWVLYYTTNHNNYDSPPTADCFTISHIHLL